MRKGVWRSAIIAVVPANTFAGTTICVIGLIVQPISQFAPASGPVTPAPARVREKLTALRVEVEAFLKELGG